MASIYEDFITAIQPPYLQRPRFLAFIGAFGKQLDSDEARLEAGARAGIIEAAPNDALALLGRDRLLRQYPLETLAQFRERLKATFPFWRKSGTQSSLVEILTVAFPGPTWTILEYFEDPATFATSGFWAQFLAVADPCAPIGKGYKYGAFPGPGDGKLYGDPDFTYGSDLTSVEVELLRGVVRDYKPAYAVNAGFKIVFPDTTFVILLPNFQ
jgi:hypothetical protein